MIGALLAAGCVVAAGASWRATRSVPFTLTVLAGAGVAAVVPGGWLIASGGIVLASQLLDWHERRR